MLRSRLLNLSVLASWLFVWGNAALHDHGNHSCGSDHSHAQTEIIDTVISKCCRHDHSHKTPLPEDETPVDLPVATGHFHCHFCELLTVAAEMPQTVGVESVEVLRVQACMVESAPFVSRNSFTWQQRGPPTC